MFIVYLGTSLQFKVIRKALGDQVSLSLAEGVVATASDCFDENFQNTNDGHWQSDLDKSNFEWLRLELLSS